MQIQRQGLWRGDRLASEESGRYGADVMSKKLRRDLQDRNFLELQ